MRGRFFAVYGRFVYGYSSVAALKDVGFFLLFYGRKFRALFVRVGVKIEAHVLKRNVARVRERVFGFAREFSVGIFGGYNYFVGFRRRRLFARRKRQSKSENYKT